MAVTSIALAPTIEFEDPLAYLPCSAVASYRSREVIYGHSEPSSRLFLVIEGKVMVSRLVDGTQRVVVDIYQADEFFGESAVLHLPHRLEDATAVDETKVMSWSIDDIDSIIARKP